MFRCQWRCERCLLQMGEDLCQHRLYSIESCCMVTKNLSVFIKHDVLTHEAFYGLFS